MSEKAVNQPELDTNFRYAIIAGWLIIPALTIIFNLLSVINVLFTLHHFNIGSIDLLMYTPYVLLAFFYGFIIYAWIKRKRILTKLMIFNYILAILLELPSLFPGLEIDAIYILFNLLWLGYFVKSRRVKETFTN